MDALLCQMDGLIGRKNFSEFFGELFKGNHVHAIHLRFFND